MKPPPPIAMNIVGATASQADLKHSTWRRVTRPCPSGRLGIVVPTKFFLNFRGALLNGVVDVIIAQTDPMHRSAIAMI